MERPWHRQYDFWVPKSLNYPRQPLSYLIDLAANIWADRPATVFFGEQLTYRNVRFQAEQLATALADLGLQRGDRIGLMLPNCPQYVIGYYAILKLGGIVVNVNPLYVEREIEHIVNDSGMQSLIALDLTVPRVLKVKEHTGLQSLVVTGIQDYLPEPIRPFYIERLRSQGQLPAIPESPSIHHWVPLMEKVEKPRIRRPDVDPVNDVAVLQYTGGTTGVPKAAMLTHRNLLANALQCYLWNREYSRLGQEVFLGAIPFFHSYGMTVAMNTAITLGASMVLLPRFDISEVLAAIKAYQPTFFPGVPTMYIAVLNHPEVGDSGISSVRLCNSGAAALPVEVYDTFARFSDGIFTEGYGLSEASPVTHSNPVLGEKKVGSIGVPFPDTDCKIVDLGDGHEVGPGEIGELLISGPQVMKGYWNKPEETAATLRDGWLYTGDIARMDEDGYFYIVDRKKDMIIAGGFNIYPREVEEVLFTHPKILEAAVVGVPDPYRGETVKAFVVLKPGEEATEDEIRTFCRTQLTGYKVPTSVEFRKELPKSNIGKVLRRELR